MNITKREYDRMKAKINDYHEELKTLRYEVSILRKKSNRHAFDLDHKRVLMEDNKVLEYSNQKLRERMANILKVGRDVNSYC